MRALAGAGRVAGWRQASGNSGRKLEPAAASLPARPLAGVPRSWQEALPRPTRSIVDWLLATRVAPVADRWRALARLRAAFPVLLAQSDGRLYQLPYLDARRRAAFTASFLVGKPASSWLLGQLAYGGVPYWPAVRSELVSVHLARLAAWHWRLVLEASAFLGAPKALPVPRRELLLLRLLTRKKKLR